MLGEVDDLASFFLYRQYSSVFNSVYSSVYLTYCGSDKIYIFKYICCTFSSDYKRFSFAAVLCCNNSVLWCDCEAVKLVRTFDHQWFELICEGHSQKQFLGQSETSM